MSEAVLVSVSWTVKSGRVDDTITMLGGMFAETRRRAGFRNIRLLRSEGNLNAILLLEEWDSAADFGAYVAFRTETGDLATLIDMAEIPPKIDIWLKSPLAEVLSPYPN